MADILIKDTLLVTVDELRPGYFIGDILVKGDKISRISEHPEKIDSKAAEVVIDGRNLLVMPGLVNTHGHAAMTLLRSYADDLPLQEWLEEKIWPIEEHLTADDVYWGSMLAICEMLKGGTTTFKDMYFFMDKVAEAAAESGIRAFLSRGMIGFGDSAAKGLKETEEFIKNWHGAEGGRINITLGPHAPYTCPPPYLEKVIALATKSGRPLQIHLSETKREVEESIAQHGASPIELVYRLGLFAHQVTAAHCVHVSDHDMEILAENQVGVAHNPGSNLKLGSGVAPVARMLAKGIKVGIGTDGASSNNNLDMFEELRLTSLLAKGIAMDPTLIDAKTALRMATVTGAEALFLEDCGCLKEGWKADLIGLRLDVPHLTPMHDPTAQIVYAASAADVDLVLVDGKIVLEKGELLTIDEAKIRAEATRCATRLVGAVKEKEGK
ncbi:MAG: amidohydrolase [Firmicutes bacterium]|nr:amidohydrolase [Bacillota bacterium]